MPDLTIETYSWCKSNEVWERKVSGSKGQFHTVSYGKLSNPKDCSHGYVCDCLSFKFHPHKPCKHILVVQNERCSWNVEACWGSAEPRSADGKCPKCGGELTGIRVGV